MQEKEKKIIYHKMCTPFAFSTRKYFCIYFIFMSLKFFATLPIMLARIHVVTRGRGYQLLEHPQIQRVLAHPPTACVQRMNTGEVVELFDGGWLPLDEGLPLVRLIVARHPAPPAGKSVTVGKRI